MVILYKKTRLKWLYMPVDGYIGWYAATLAVKDKMPEKDHDKYVLNSVYGFWEFYYKIYFKIIPRKFGDNEKKNKIMSIVKNVKMIEVSDWDGLVSDTYNRPYSFQQQDGCKSRGMFNITIPSEDTFDHELPESVPELINGSEMGVKFKNWLERDPKQPVNGDTKDWMIDLFWVRNFYPDVQTVANDLFTKGLIDAGTYIINIDW